MKLEILKLSKPYPFFKVCRDGKDFVLSLLDLYIRVSR